MQWLFVALAKLLCDVLKRPMRPLRHGLSESQLPDTREGLRLRELRNLNVHCLEI